MNGAEKAVVSIIESNRQTKVKMVLFCVMELTKLIQFTCLTSLVLLFIVVGLLSEANHLHDIIQQLKQQVGYYCAAHSAPKSIFRSYP